LHWIARHHLYSVLFHPACQGAAKDNVIVTFDLHHPATQDPGHGALHLDQIVSAHGTPLGHWSKTIGQHHDTTDDSPVVQQNALGVLTRS